MTSHIFYQYWADVVFQSINLQEHISMKLYDLIIFIRWNTFENFVCKMSVILSVSVFFDMGISDYWWRVYTYVSWLGQNLLRCNGLAPFRLAAKP